MLKEFSWCHQDGIADGWKTWSPRMILMPKESGNLNWNLYRYGSKLAAFLLTLPSSKQPERPKSKQPCVNQEKPFNFSEENNVDKL